MSLDYAQPPLAAAAPVSQTRLKVQLCIFMFLQYYIWGSWYSSLGAYLDGVLNFDALLPELNRSGCPGDWWTIDLCFWPDAWAVTERCKAAVDRLNEKYG